MPRDYLVGLFLDDERTVDNVTWIKYHDNIDWRIVRTVAQFEKYLEQNPMPDVISFDHDLADFSHGERTGFDAAKALVAHDQRIHEHTGAHAVWPRIHVHSQNPIGAKRIWDYLAQYYLQFR